MSKPLIFDSRSGPVPVVLHVDAYQCNNRLYLSLLTESGYIREPYCNLTVNLTESPLLLNEAFINNDVSEEALAFIQKYQLGTILPGVGRSGYCTYRKVAFDMAKLKGLDPAGMKRYYSYHRKTYDFLLCDTRNSEEPGTAVYFLNGLDACQEKVLANMLCDARLESPKDADTDDIISLGLKKFQEKTGVAWRYKEIGTVMF